MIEIKYTETDQNGLDSIAPLWRKLNEEHRVRSEQFSGIYAKRTFDWRKKVLLEKSEPGSLHICMARDSISGDLLDYCVSTISEDNRGEIDSIYIEPDYRKYGIGDALMERALSWLNEHSVTRKVVNVGTGNENVLTFYGRYGFYPRTIILEQTDGPIGYDNNIY